MQPDPQGPRAGSVRRSTATPFAKRSEHVFVYAGEMTDPDAAQRALLRTLLEAHPAMLTTEEVRRRLSDVPEWDEAVEHLVRDGLATQLDE